MFFRIILVVFSAAFYLPCKADDIIDSTNITDITAQDHPDHVDPEYEPGQANLSFDNESISNGTFGDLDTDADLSVNSGSDLNFVEGLAANPLTSNLSDYQYSQMDVVHATFTQNPIANN